MPRISAFQRGQSEAIIIKITISKNDEYDDGNNDDVDDVDGDDNDDDDAIVDNGNDDFFSFLYISMNRDMLCLK